MGLEGCSTFSQPGNLFGGLFSAGSSTVISMVASLMGVPAGVGWALWGHLLGWDHKGFFWKSYALENILIGEGDVALHLFLKVYHAPHQKVWFTPSRQINLLCPELKGPGICHDLLMLNFLDILACKDRIWWWQKILQVKAQWYRWGLMVILHLVLFTCPLWESERGPYLMCHLFIVIDPGYHG